MDNNSKENKNSTVLDEEIYTVTAEKMVFGGDCMAKINGKNVFFPYAIPGEKLLIKITKNLRDYNLAKIVKIIEPSPDRTEPFCPLYTQCGGCNMQHIKIDRQRQLRSQMLRECFERAGVNCPEIVVISGKERAYRSRVQLTDGSFNRRDSNSTVELKNCPVATDAINHYLEQTSQFTRPRGRVHFFGDERLVECSGPFPNLAIADEAKNDLWQQKVTGKKSKVKNRVKQRFAGTTSSGQNLCKINLLNRHTVQFDVKGFFQSNIEVLEKTIEQIVTNIGGNNVLDMYSGCGTLSVFLADLFKKTVMVEHNRDALVNAELNLQGKPHETYGVSGAKFVEQNAAQILKHDGPFDAVVIDPPRSGMEKEVCRWLCDNKTPILKSLSCDPATHARDAAMLIKSGYTMTKLFLLDFYPQTSHIESLAFFES